MLFIYVKEMGLQRWFWNMFETDSLISFSSSLQVILAVVILFTVLVSTA